MSKELIHLNFITEASSVFFFHFDFITTTQVYKACQHVIRTLMTEHSNFQFNFDRVSSGCIATAALSSGPALSVVTIHNITIFL